MVFTLSVKSPLPVTNMGNVLNDPFSHICTWAVIFLGPLSQTPIPDSSTCVSQAGNCYTETPDLRA